MSHLYVHDKVTEFHGLPRKLPIAPHTRLCIKNTMTNETAFKMTEKPLPKGVSKSLLDAKYNGIYHMTQEPSFSKRRTFIKDLRTNQLVATIRRKQLESQFLDGVHVWRGLDENEPWLCIQGSILRMDFTIYDKEMNDREVAEISQKNGQYVVRVTPGYDTSLICFLAMTVHDQFIAEDEEDK